MKSVYVMGKELLSRIDNFIVPYLVQGREGDTLGDRLGHIAEKASLGTAFMLGGADTTHYVAERLFERDKETNTGEISDRFIASLEKKRSMSETIIANTLGRLNERALPTVHVLLLSIAATEPKFWHVIALSISAPGLNHLKNIAEKAGMEFEVVYAPELKKLPGSYPVKMESTGKHGYVFKAIQNTILIIGEEKYSVPAGRVFVQEESGKGKVLTKEKFERECRFDRNTNPTLNFI